MNSFLPNFPIKYHSPYTPTAKTETSQLICNPNTPTGFHKICENAENKKCYENIGSKWNKY